METIYLTRIHWRDHEQEILLSCNEAPENLWIPEEVRLDYSDAVCRYVLEGGPTWTDNVSLIYPASDVARFLRFHSFVSVPIEIGEDQVFGTLCGASTGPVSLDDLQLMDMRRCARRIALWLRSSGVELPAGIAAN
jgi:diguanylate cyclase